MVTTKYIIILTAVLTFQLKSFGQTIVSDTTFISRNASEGIYHAIYIENNKKSKYYDWITNFKFDNNDSLSYKESIKSIFGDNKIKIPKKKIASPLPQQWCSLYNYKDKFYLYAPSDWGNNSKLIISDTTIIQYFMDGPYASVLDSFKTIDPNTFELTIHSTYTTTKKITIHIINWKKQIAIFDNNSENEDSRYNLMVGAPKAKEFPIIVNYCEEQKQVEFNFDKTDYKKLLMQK